MAGVRRVLLFCAAVCALVTPATRAQAAQPVDPGGWSAATPFSAYRYGVVGVPLRDGALIVVHGERRAWRYRTDGDRLVVARAAPVQLSSPRATRMADGQVVVVSGRDVLNYDPAADRWSHSGMAPVGRQFIGLLGLPDGRVFAASSNGQSDECAVLDSRLQNAVTVAQRQNARCAIVGKLRGGRVAFALNYQHSESVIGIFDAPTMRSTLLDMPTTARGKATVLSTGEILFVGEEFHTATQGGKPVSWYVRRAWLFDPDQSRWTEVAAPSRDPYWADLVPLANGGAAVVGGEARDCWELDTACASGFSEAETKPIRSAQTFDRRTRTWNWVEAAPAGPRVAVPLDNGRVLFVGEARFVLSPPGLADHEKPRSTTKTTTLRDRDPLSVHGVSEDGFSGIRSVRVTYTSRLAVKDEPVVRASMTLDCTPGRHRCTWSARSPRLDPGTYYVSVSATDRAGNVETSSGRRTVVVA